MTLPINAINHEGKMVRVFLDKLPDRCPSCRMGIQPLFRTAHVVTSDFRPFFAAFICPFDNCQVMFIARYRVSILPLEGKVVNLEGTPPLNYVKPPEFAKSIAEMSPRFVRIYAQATLAETNELDEIAGSGYRKALEFLIKDFILSDLIHDDEEQQKQVRRGMLSDCIRKFIEDTRIQEAARRAAWFGNDETHYERRWEEKDISDLKTLINMTVNWVSLVVESKKIITEMPEGGGKR